MIGQDVSDYQPSGKALRHRALLHQVRWIYHLRVTEPYTGRAPELHPAVHTGKGESLHQPSVTADRSGEIDVFLPAIKAQSFVEPRRANGRGTIGHVATVKTVKTCHDTVRTEIALLVLRDQFLRVLERDAGAVDAIADDIARRADHFGMCYKELLDLLDTVP
ncbi:hypothetical protein ADT71_02135 [Novosphingobium sp. ST904]|nr:hypothetical protein ADT71_02135 [Novosphingobium sp. ST904]